MLQRYMHTCREMPSARMLTAALSAIAETSDWNRRLIRKFVIHHFNKILQNKIVLYILI